MQEKSVVNEVKNYLANYYTAETYFESNCGKGARK
jgi:hypothetical protein